jgi:hypothetical protein
LVSLMFIGGCNLVIAKTANWLHSDTEGR